VYRQTYVPLNDSKRAVAKSKKNKSKLTRFETLPRQAERRLFEQAVDLSDMPLEDITERKKSELALIAAKQQLESIVQTVPDIIYRLDPHGRLIFVNDSVKRYGYEPEELLGTNVMKIVYPEDKAKTIHRIKERRTGVRSTKSFETRLITRNQTPVSFEVFIISAEGLYSPSKAGLGDFLGTQGIARDITERKQAEEEREKLISKLQEALDNIKTLKGLLPICSNCKKIRDDQGYWNQIEAYIRDHSDAEFSHGICPDCAQDLYSEFIRVKAN
jgi:PAS domain S-box-containing protein